MSLPSIGFTDFSGGVNKQADDFTLPDNQFRTGVNLRVDKGSLRLVGGAANMFASRASIVNGFTRYIRSDGTSFIVFAQGAASAGIYAYNETASTVTLLSASGASTPVSFERFGSNLYIAERNQDLRVWTGSGTLRTAGMFAPVFAPSLDSLDASGSLTGEYYYTTTNENDRGIESDPSPESGPITATSESIEITIPAQSNPLALDATWINIYRRGNGVTTPLYVDRIPFSASASNFIDNIPDDDLSTRTPPENNAMPSRFAILHNHDNRLWGVEHESSRIHYSGRSRPEYFPAITDDEWLYGGYTDVDDVRDDYVIGLSSIGNTVVAGRMRSVFAIDWDGEKYRPYKVSNEGILSPRVMVRGIGELFWIGRDFTVRRMTDRGAEEVSDPLRDHLRETYDGVSGGFNLSTSLSTLTRIPCAAFHEGRYILILPDLVGGSGPLTRAFSLDVKRGVWEDLSHALYDAIDLKSLPRVSGGRPDLLMAASGGVAGTSNYTDVNGNPYFGVVRILDDTITSELSISYQSDKFDMNARKRRKRLHRVRILGTITQGSPAVALGINIDGVTHTHALTGTSGTLLDTRLPNSYTGYEFYALLSGDCTDCNIQSIEFQYSMLEESWK